MISRLPEPEDTVRLWDYVTGPAGFPGFAELKRRALRRTRRFFIDRDDLRGGGPDYGEQDAGRACGRVAGAGDLVRVGLAQVRVAANFMTE